MDSCRERDGDRCGSAAGEPCGDNPPGSAPLCCGRRCAPCELCLCCHRFLSTNADVRCGDSSPVNSTVAASAHPLPCWCTLSSPLRAWESSEDDGACVCGGGSSATATLGLYTSPSSPSSGRMGSSSLPISSSISAAANATSSAAPTAREVFGRDAAAAGHKSSARAWRVTPSLGVSEGGVALTASTEGAHGLRGTVVVRLPTRMRILGMDGRLGDGASTLQQRQPTPAHQHRTA
jgi:hypothetical protein